MSTQGITKLLPIEVPPDAISIRGLRMDAADLVSGRCHLRYAAEAGERLEIRIALSDGQKFLRWLRTSGYEFPLKIR